MANDELILVVHRTSLLGELLKPIEPDNIHVDQKLAKIDNDCDGRMLLYFEVSSTEHIDALAGTDSLHSYVQQNILGTGPSAIDPIFTGR